MFIIFLPCSLSMLSGVFAMFIIFLPGSLSMLSFCHVHYISTWFFIYVKWSFCHVHYISILSHLISVIQSATVVTHLIMSLCCNEKVAFYEGWSGLCKWGYVHCISILLSQHIWNLGLIKTGVAFGGEWHYKRGTTE